MKIIKKLSYEPYKTFYDLFSKAKKSQQKDIQAISISSYNKKHNEVDSRYVNLKYINGEEWIFFSNYNSPKSEQFDSHSQISAIFFWHKINTQIRIKAKIEKTSVKYNEKYFSKRTKEKNALAISSNQSKTIESYNHVEKNYYHSLKSDNLKKCPRYWGGFSFIPYYFEY